MDDRPPFMPPEFFKSRLEECDRWENERKLVENQLVLQYESLRSSYDGMVAEVRAMWGMREEMKAMREKIINMEAALRGLMNASPFVLVLIDGDGALFHEYLYAQGWAGGKEAAQLLQADIRAFLRDRYPDVADTSSWSVLVYVVAHADGLGRKLYSLNMVDQGPADVHAFGIGFGIAQPLFNFIDCGSGKEMADHKVREMLRAMARVPQCRHVIFGPSHDSGYVPVLQQYSGDGEVAPKLTLLETVPAMPGFADLGFDFTSFPSVFRDEHLPARLLPIPAAVLAPAVPPSPIRVATVAAVAATAGALQGQGQPPPQSTGTPTLNGHSATPRAAVRHNSGSNNSSFKFITITPTATPAATATATPTPDLDPAIIASPIPATPPSPPPTSPEPVSASSSWATVGRANGPPLGKVIEIGSGTKRPAPVRKFYYLNRYGERIDPQLPARDAQADRRLHERMARDGKFCNKFHLLGRCEATAAGLGQEGCSYRHGERLPPAELNALRYKARGLRCSQGFDCRDPSCIFGHHCKYSALGQRCTSESCRFDDTHGSSYVNDKKVYDDGQEEYVGG